MSLFSDLTREILANLKDLNYFCRVLRDYGKKEEKGIKTKRRDKVTHQGRTSKYEVQVVYRDPKRRF